METATKAHEGVRPADKVLQALASLAALIDSTIREVKSLDSEFQNRLLEAVHDTEVTLQAQSAEHVELARQEVQEQLNGKFQNDLQVAIDGLKAEFETERGRFNSEKSNLIAEVERVKTDAAAEIEKAREELKNAVHKTEVLLQAEATEGIERARQEVQEQLNGKFQNDLQVAIDGLKAEFEIERGRFNSEKSDLIAQVEQVKTDSAAEIEKALESAKKALHDSEASLQAQASENIARARQEVHDELNAKYRRDLQTTREGLDSEFEIERERLDKQLLQTVEAASKLEAEKLGLLAEVQKVKADSAAQIEKALESAKKALHDSEASLQAQAGENIARARQEVHDELSAKYHRDLQTTREGLDSEFEIERERLDKQLLQTVEAASKLEAEKLELIAEVQKVKADSAAQIEKALESAKKALHDSEASLQAQAAENIERARQEVQDQLNGKYRKDLEAAIVGVKSEFQIERERLNKELSHTVDVASKLEAERSGLITQLQQVQTDSAAEIEKAVEKAKAAAAKQPTSVAPSPPPASLQQEIARTEAKLSEVLKLIDNPATELSTVIRKNVEKSELEAYLRGIRLVLDSKN